MVLTEMGCVCRLGVPAGALRVARVAVPGQALEDAGRGHPVRAGQPDPGRAGAPGRPGPDDALPRLGTQPGGQGAAAGARHPGLVSAARACHGTCDALIDRLFSASYLAHASKTVP